MIINDIKPLKRMEKMCLILIFTPQKLYSHIKNYSIHKIHRTTLAALVLVRAVTSWLVLYTQTVLVRYNWNLRILQSTARRYIKSLKFRLGIVNWVGHLTWYKILCTSKTVCVYNTSHEVTARTNTNAARVVRWILCIL